MIKNEQDGMKVAVFYDFGDENFCIKLSSDGVAHFMTISKALALANMINKTVEQFNNKNRR